MGAGCSRQALVRRRTLLASAVAAVGLACAAGAQAHRFAGPDPVDLQVVDRESGQVLQLWRRDGRLYVAGKPGDRYSLRVTNHTGARVLVVLSVDGVNIFTGETAGYDQRGYIFGPGDTYDLIGWRKSLADVADFVFAPLPQSYAARTGRPQNVGVIGMAVFNEKVEVDAEAERAPPAAARSPRRPLEPRLALREAAPPPPSPVTPPTAAPAKAAGASSVAEEVVTAGRRESRAQSAPVAISAFTSSQRDVATPERQDEKLGTGHGEREYSPTYLVAFERATPYPQFTCEIQYDTYDHLVAAGVIPRWRYGERRPRPFPSSPDPRGFVPDPPDDP